jgi:SAM-dependent methyltransferase
LGRVFPALERAYRDGTGVPYADYGVQHVQAAVNRPLWSGPLVRQWLPALPELHTRLTAGATVAELGCGHGLAAVALARAYPGLRVHGFDLDATSIEAARWRALTDGLADRVRFDVADVAETPPAAATGGYDAVFAFEMLHDLAHPVAALRTARLLARNGASPVIVMEGRTDERFQAPADPAERFRYASSVLHCLPVGRCEPGSAATGTVLRPATLRGYAEAAGFARLETLPFEHEMFRCYLLEG